MVLCNEDCLPCCDFCTHVIHETEEIDGKVVTFGPIGCKLHLDKEHQDCAEGCAYCEDFHCFMAEEGKNMEEQ